MSILGGLLRRLIAWGEAVGALSTALIALVVVYDVAARAAGYPTLWALEISGYLMIGASVLAAGEVLRKGGHFEVRFVLLALPPRARQRIDAAVTVVSFAFVAAVTAGCLQLLAQTYEFGFRSPTLLHVPLVLPQGVLCLGLVLLSLSYAAKLHDMLRGNDGSGGPQGTAH